ncbi:MAG: polymer-forming cytoskeletal protein [Spirochaetales bacterium]|nr:polymer-forming cytoskeletal protein [Spirochaetales bacterium]
MADFSVSQHTESIYSIIGEGTKFKGEFEVNGLLRIDGDFIGSIKTTGKVLVSKNGRAECTINGSTVIIGGLVKGTVIATEKVEILSTGMVFGHIETPRLVVHEGVLLHGTCQVNNGSGAMPQEIISLSEKETSDSSAGTATPEIMQHPELELLEKKII